MLQRLIVFLLTTAISTFCVANENNKLDLSGLSNEKIAAAKGLYEVSNVEGMTTETSDAMFSMMLAAMPSSPISVGEESDPHQRMSAGEEGLNVEAAPEPSQY